MLTGNRFHVINRANARNAIAHANGQMLGSFLANHRPGRHQRRWLLHMEKLETLGGFLLGIFVLTAVGSLIGLFFAGAAWFSGHLLPLFSEASLASGTILFLILLPLSILKKARPFTAVIILVVSFIFGITLWMEGLFVTLSTWGTLAVVIGLLIGGIGVVPVGMLAAVFHGLWGAFFELLILVILTYSSRIFSQWAATSYST